MVKILGLIDVLAGVALFSIMGGVVHMWAFLLLVVVLSLKASIAFFDIGGIIDIFVALLIFLSLFILMPSSMITVGLILILIKGVISLAS